MNSLISIIIPTYNSAKFLPETLDSVLKQSYQNFEIIVIDDKSTDGTENLFVGENAPYKNSKINYVRLEKNFGGPAGPRNKGLELAKGSYICFLDSDDVWQPNKLEVQLMRMLDEEIGFSSTRRTIFSDLVSFTPRAKTKDIPLTYGSLLKKNVIFTSSVMVNADLIKPLRFDTQKIRVAVEDYEMWLTILKKNNPKALIIGEYLIHYRVHSNSISRAKLKMAKKVWNLLGSKNFEINPIRRAYCFAAYAWHSTVHKLVE